MYIVDGGTGTTEIVLCPSLLLLLSTDTNLSRTGKDIVYTRSRNVGYYVYSPCREYQVTVVFVLSILGVSRFLENHF